MALFQYCWSATMKLALPLLVVVAIAAATPSISAAKLENDNGALASVAGAVPAAGHGRFSASHVSRRLLQFSLCGSSCKNVLPFASNPQCCTIGLISACFDVGSDYFDKCGSCTTVCSFGQFCCSGTCVNLLTNPNSCGFCGNKCADKKCTNGLCGYGI